MTRQTPQKISQSKQNSETFSEIYHKLNRRSSHLVVQKFMKKKMEKYVKNACENLFT